MTRTIISLSDEDQRWLNEFSRHKQCPKAKIIREALGEYRRKQQLQGMSYKQIIEKTSGIGKGHFGDAVKYVRKIRSEWDK